MKRDDLILVGKILVGVLGIVIVCLFFKKSYTEEIDVEDEEWVNDNVSIVESKINSIVYEVEKDEDITTYNMTYQDVINNKINELLENDYDINNPLIIYNPYSTNSNSINIYFNTLENVEVSYTISVSGYDDFSKTLNNDGNNNYTTSHSYQLIGFILGYNNYLTLTLTNEEDEEVEYSWELDFTNYSNSAQTELEVDSTDSLEELSNGLYAILGDSSDVQDYLYLYDNSGILRSEIPIIGYRALRLLFNDDKMYVSISEKRIAQINSLGMVNNVYVLDGYKLHHDYAFDDDGNLLVLATDEENSSCEDAIIKLDLETGEITDTFYLEEVFPDLRESAYYNEEEVADEVESVGVDWMHINTINYLGKDTVILSSRETSSIIKINNIFDEPQIEYILGDESFWEDYDESIYLYKKIGDFTIQGGQHSINYIETDEGGVYYLTMFNNNLGISTTVPDFDWSSIGLVYSTPKDDGVSYYYKYKVDENNKTFELVESFEVPWSAYMSSVQEYDGNIIVDSASQCTFSERNNDGEIISSYVFDCESSIYRVYKYDFSGYWFK